MADNRSPSKRDAWRQGASSGKGDKQDKNLPAWKRNATPEQKPISPQKKRKIKLGIALGSLAVVIGLLAAILLWPRAPKTACVVLIGSGYEHNLALPHNAAGWNGLKQLAGLAEAASGLTSRLPWVKSKQLRLHMGPTNVDGNTKWEEDIWAKLLTRPKEATMIIFLSLHGGADEKGAYLLADDPNLEKRIYVSQILDKLKDPSLEGKNKVLIIDATQMAVNWQSGMFVNDFASQLKRLADKAKAIPNLFVMCASDIDQRSWVSPQWQKTIFAHYVIEGLKGAADGHGEGNNRNNHVTAWELFEYVRDRVKAWADVNRNRVQVPIALGSKAVGENIDLFQVEEAYKETEYNKAPGLSANLTARIATEWGKWTELRSKTPHPHVYSPHLWRYFQDTLVRYEELLRLGDPTNQRASFQKKLNRLYGEITQARKPLPVVKSLGNTLAMPNVLGVSPPWTTDQLRAHVRRLMLLSSEKIEQDASVWDPLKQWFTDLKKKPTMQDYQLLVVGFSKAVLSLLCDDVEITGDSIRKAGRLLQVFYELQRVASKNATFRDAEGHFLVMLQTKDVISNPGPSAKLLQLAVRVRMLGEEAAVALDRRTGNAAIHPYSEFVWQWIEKGNPNDAVKSANIEDADAERRKGEDLLFGPKTGWTSAEQYLQNARKQYEAILAEAGLVRNALEMRDKMAAQVPYFARWLGRRSDQPRETAALIKTAKRLSTNLLKLNDELSNKKSTNLKNLTDDLARDHDEIERAFTKFCQGIGTQHTHPKWHQIQNALRIPLIANLKTRESLIATSKNASSDWHDDPVVANKVAPATAQQLEASARKRGEQEAVMAIAAAGVYHFGAASYLKVQTSFTDAPDSGWRTTFLRVGKQIGAQWHGSLILIDQKWKSSINATDLTVATEVLKSAAQRCQFLTFGDVHRQVKTIRIGSHSVGPVQGLRRLQTHHLLVWQTKRTWKDHWFMGSDIPKRTFYVPVVKNFLDDAIHMADFKSKLPQTQKMRLAETTRLREYYGQVVGLEAIPKGGGKQFLLGGDKLQLQWHVQATTAENAGKLPKGTPMFWLDAQGYKEAREPIIWPTPKTYPFITEGNELHKIDLLPEQQEQPATFKGVYRGQKITSAVTVAAQKSPDIVIYRYPPKTKAQLGVFMAKDVAYGAICLALDFSGSMKWDVDGNVNSGKKSRIEYVREALVKVLPKIPRGTFLSVIGFNADNNIGLRAEWLRKPGEWTHDDVETRALLRRFDQKRDADIEKGYFTPIAKVMDFARNEGFPQNFENKGPRLVFVLSDGMDTYFTQFRKGGTDENEIATYIAKRFGKGKIKLRLACFGVKESGSEGKKIHNQFDFIKEFDYPGTPKGKVLFQTDPAGLATTIEGELRPQFQLYLPNGTVLGEFKPARVVRPTVYNRDFGPMIDFSPKLNRGSEFLADTTNAKQPRVGLRAGQLLILELFRDDSNFLLFRRPSYCDLAEREGPNKNNPTAQLSPNKMWKAAVLQNSHDSNNGEITQLVCMEPKANLIPGENEILQQTAPKLIWLELKDHTGQQAKGLHWQQVYGYGAPAFRLKAATFLSDKESNLSVWMIDDVNRADIGGNILRFGEFVEKKSFPVVDATITIEKRLFQSDEPADKHFVYTSKVLRNKKACYVFHVSYNPSDPDNPGKVRRPPVIIRPSTGSFGGEEHRYFLNAGRYTALFWDETNNSDLKFRFISIQRMKSAGQAMRWKMRPPSQQDEGPKIRVVELDH